MFKRLIAAAALSTALFHTIAPTAALTAPLIALFMFITTRTTFGRRIYANLRRAMSYVLAVHVPIAGMALPDYSGTPVAQQ